VRILAVDTATSATVVGAVIDGQFTEVEHVDARGHASQIGILLRAIVEATGNRDWDMIVCGVGPGPFTGLRVGIAACLGIAAVQGLPTIGVCTLDAIRRVAATTHPRESITVATRARRNEVYWARYDSVGHRTAGPIALPTDEARARADGLVVGDGAEMVAGSDPACDAQVVFPSAQALLMIVQERLDAGEVLPRLDAGAVGLDAPASVGATTARALAQQAAAGRQLLPMRPLYLRRPDAVPTVDRS